MLHGYKNTILSLARQRKKKGPGKNPARLKVTTKSKPAYEKTLHQVIK